MDSLHEINLFVTKKMTAYRESLGLMEAKMDEEMKLYLKTKKKFFSNAFLARERDVYAYALSEFAELLDEIKSLQQATSDPHQAEQ